MFYSQACQDKFIVNVLKGKRDGAFLEIGGGDPIITNNTYTLEKNYGWKGIMVEYQTKFEAAYKESRPNSIHILGDATKVDYKSVFVNNNMPASMDYLQIDLEVNNRSTLTTLEMLDRDIFDNHTFATVTFEHDIYTGNHYNTREISRQIFSKRGYVSAFQDVCDHQSAIVFEDWYVHPTLVDMEYVNALKANNEQNYVNNRVTTRSINCQNITYTSA